MLEGACDCHTHVIGPAGAYPMVAQRHYTPGPAPVDALRSHLSALGFQRVVVVQPSVYGTDNRCLIDTLAGMVALSLFAAPLIRRLTGSPRAGRALLLVAGVQSCALGVFWAGRALAGL